MAAERIRPVKSWMHDLKHFENTSIKYDRKKGIIQVGEEMGENETIIKVNEQIVCGLDRNSDLKCIYIIPTRFIGENP